MQTKTSTPNPRREEEPPLSTTLDHTPALLMLRIHLNIPHMLHPISILKPLSLNLIPANPRYNLPPERPIHHTEQQNTHTHNRENVIRIPLRIPVAVRRDKRRDGEENVGGEVEHGDGQVRVPGGGPALALLVVQVDEAGGDEGVDPGAGVRVQVDDEVVGGAGGGRNEDDDGDEPVEEELGVCELETCVQRDIGNLQQSRGH